MIVVVEGPSAAGKTTWCRRHAPQWLPEPGRWPIDRVLRYQVDRWRRAVVLDGKGETVVLDGDPFKLYYGWASWCVGDLAAEAWTEAVEAAREAFAGGATGVADLVLYADPGEGELRRRKEADCSRSRRNFERNTAMRNHFRHWYETVAQLDPARVVWEHPQEGLTAELLALGRRPFRSDPTVLDELLMRLRKRP